MMSAANAASREEAINQLYETIKSKLDQDGVLREVRCLLQTKMVSLMKGNNETTPLVPHLKGDGQQEFRLRVLNQLFMEYLYWYGYHYSAEMFSQESGTENAAPLRKCLEAVLGQYENKNIPIILQVVDSMLEKTK